MIFSKKIKFGKFSCKPPWPINSYVCGLDYHRKFTNFADSTETKDSVYDMTIIKTKITYYLHLEEIFLKYKYIKSFTVSNYPLEIFETTFRNAFELEILILSRNNIRQLTDTKIFKNLKKIQKISVNFNQLVKIDSNFFQGAKNIESVSFSDNHLKSIEKGTFENISINYLDLRNNYLTEFDFTNLLVNQYSLFNNSIVSVLNSGDGQNFNTTTTLHLYNNKLTELKSLNLKKFKNLVELTVSVNLIEELTVDLFLDLKNLSILYLSSNKIRFIENGTFYNLHIDYLYLENNQLIEFDFNNMIVGFVDLSYNLLTSITIYGKSTYINVSNNNISKIYLVTRILEHLICDNNTEDLRIQFV